MSLQKLQAAFTERLKKIYSTEEAGNIFYLSLEYLTGADYRKDKTAQFNPDNCFTEMFEQIEQRLLRHEPIQYILNEAWFYDAPFFVNPSVLIPRPETEELANWIIRDKKQEAPFSILDVGTGSGCIAVTLKKKMPEARVIACDISAAALEVARKNMQKHRADIELVQLDFINPDNWSKLPGLDLLVSNPPYIPEHDKTDMNKNVLEYEPHQALFVEDGQPLLFYEAIAKAGKQLLKKKGSIYVEIYEGLGPETMQLFNDYGYTAQLREDMQGKDRFIKCLL